MSDIDFKIQTQRLSETLRAKLQKHGEDIAEQTFQASIILLYWVDYLKKSESTGCCDEFLDGVRASIVEVCGCLAMGLVRPAIFSMRSQIDIILSWIYFKDHPIEWARLEDSGEGFILKRDVIQYLRENIKFFKARFNVLLTAKTRRLDEPYQILSAHVHSQTTQVMPSHGHLDSLISRHKRCTEGVQLQAEVTEYLNDILLACFIDKWASLPDRIMDLTRLRLGKEISKLF